MFAAVKKLARVFGHIYSPSHHEMIPLLHIIGGTIHVMVRMTNTTCLDEYGRCDSLPKASGTHSSFKNRLQNSLCQHHHRRVMECPANLAAHAFSEFLKDQMSSSGLRASVGQVSVAD